MNKYTICGYMHHSESYKRYDELGYIRATKEEAIETCKRINPRFEIKSVKCDV